MVNVMVIALDMILESQRIFLHLLSVVPGRKTI